MKYATFRYDTVEAGKRALAMFPEGGQTRKHCFLAMFLDGGQTRKHRFLAIFPKRGQTRKHRFNLSHIS